MLKIDLNLFKAVFLHSAKKDVRYYLNGVHVTGKAGDVSVDVVATNGHILGKARVLQDYALKNDVSFIIDYKSCDKISKVKTKDTTIVFNEIPVLNKESVIEIGNEKVFISLQDGTFPDYKRVIAEPKNIDDFSCVGFSTEYLGNIDKVRKALGFSGFQAVKIQPTGNASGCWLYSFEKAPEFLGLIMTARV